MTKLENVPNYTFGAWICQIWKIWMFQFSISNLSSFDCSIEMRICFSNQIVIFKYFIFILLQQSRYNKLKLPNSKTDTFFKVPFPEFSGQLVHPLLQLPQFFGTTRHILNFWGLETKVFLLQKLEFESAGFKICSFVEVFNFEFPML